MPRLVATPGQGLLLLILAGQLSDVSFGSNILLFSAVPERSPILMMNMKRVLDTYTDHQVEMMSFYEDQAEVMRDQGRNVVHLIRPDLNISLPKSSDEELVGAFRQPISPSEDLDALRPVIATLAGWCPYLANNSDLVHRLLERRYHLLIVDLYANDICSMVLARKLGIPVIGLWPFAIGLPMSHYYGIPSYPSFIPAIYSGFQPEMTLSERLTNVLIGQQVLQEWNSNFYSPAMATIKQISPTISDVSDLYTDLALLIVNQDTSLEYARPLLPNVVPIGCFHCHHANDLPEYLEKFVKQFKGAVVYVSLGSTFIPNEVISALISSFSNFPHLCFLWNSEGNSPFLVESAAKVPNLKLIRTVGHQDILGHSRTRLFLGTCEQNHLLEATFHSVSLVCIICSSQQRDVSIRVRNHHLGLVLDKHNVSADTIRESIAVMLKEKSYADSSRQMSVAMRDQPETPMDRLMFSIDYVIRHNGAPYFKSPSTSLSVIQYHSLDLLFLAVSLVLLISSVLLSLLFLGVKILWKVKPIQKKKYD